MAEGSEDAAGAPPPVAESDELEFDDWTCSLQEVKRLEADPEDEEPEDIFSVVFQVDGPNANAEVEILVTDHDDEAAVIAVALDTLHRAMKAWGRLTENRRIAARDPIA